MCKTIKQKVIFQAEPKVIYGFFSDSKKHAGLTGAKAKINKKVGGPISAYDGFISGVIVDLKPAQRIVWAWREQKFPTGIFSMVTINLVKTKSGGTELTLIHRGVPKELIPKVEMGWRNGYWKKIKALLSDS